MSDPFGFGDAEEIRARLAQQVADAQVRAAAASRVRDEIDAVRERASTPDESIIVTVDSAGRLLDLDLASPALRLAPDRLAREILSLAVQAQRASADRAVQIASEAFGATDPAVANLRGEVDAFAYADLDQEDPR